MIFQIELIKQAFKPLLDKGYISSKNLEYLVVPKPRLGRFYLLPKIHKRLENMPGRSVISNCGTATERVSEFLDFHIQPLVEGVPSVIKDSTHFFAMFGRLRSYPIDCNFVHYGCSGIVSSYTTQRRS